MEGLTRAGLEDMSARGRAMRGANSVCCRKCRDHFGDYGLEYPSNIKFASV